MVSDECKIYVGGLPKDANENEITKVFQRYGTLKNVWVARNPPGFAFVEFEDTRDGYDAIKATDGTIICGNRCRVEKSKTRSDKRPTRRYDHGEGRRNYDNDKGGKAFSPSDRCYECNGQGHYAYDCDKRKSGRREYSGRNERTTNNRYRSRSRSYDRRINHRYERSTSPRRY
ncbi:hypothetical protein A3Q56_03319 [Intoshia linei]|uniref:Splicing factor, arginine/serine-rich 7 n=1 Tax=Intoshia linei TaxID=1819745 RepID=A0A177B3T5_9BILA|nr:hypothetical protein A3Q56_03319 [Intoshia linei]